MATPLEEEFSLGEELLDAVVVAVFGDVVVSLAVLDGMGDQAELARAGPVSSAEGPQQLALRANKSAPG